MNLLLISGGRHPYEESTPILENFLREAGHSVEVRWDTDALDELNSLAAYDALVFNTLRYGETALTKLQQDNVSNFIFNGKSFICIHISGCAPESWPEYSNITGGGWAMGKSFHPPYGQFTVTVSQPDHPAVLGLSDFVTNDELYMGLEYSDDNDIFMTAYDPGGTHEWGGKPKHMPSGTFPLGWTRYYGNGKVFVTLLGHNGLSFETPEFQRILLNGIEWAT